MGEEEIEEKSVPDRQQKNGGDDIIVEEGDDVVVGGSVERPSENRSAASRGRGSLDKSIGGTRSPRWREDVVFDDGM
jgi:hypothetical protein